MCYSLAKIIAFISIAGKRCKVRVCRCLFPIVRQIQCFLPALDSTVAVVFCQLIFAQD